MPPATKNLILINLAIWLVEIIFPGAAAALMRHTALHFWGSRDFNPVQVVTYMFMHDTGSVYHILFNMFTLWMFGRILEQVWGSRRFLFYYLFCGVGAALVQEAVWQLVWLKDYASAIAPQNGLTADHMRQVIQTAMADGDVNFLQGAAMFKNMLLTVGASGAIFGLLLGFAFTFPDMPLYLFFIPIPIKAKYMVVGYGVVEFFLGVAGAQSTVAHFAHLGGLLFGLVLLLWWRHRHDLRNAFHHGSRYAQRPKPARVLFNRSKRSAAEGFDLGSLNTRKMEDRRRLNELLDKIRTSGYSSLTHQEREELKQLSKRVE